MPQFDNTSDPFQQVVDAMTKMSSDASPLAVKVDSLRSTIDSVNAFLQSVVDVNVYFKDAVTAITDVRDICSGLDEVPGLGEFTAAAATVLGGVLDFANPVSSSLNDFVSGPVSQAQSAMGDVKTNVDKLDAALDGIVNDVPIFTNTVAILQALYQIAVGLATALHGSEMANKLDALINDYDTLQTEVLLGVTPIEKVISLIEHAVDTVAGAFSSALSSAEKIESALSSLKSVDTVLNPIRSAVNAIEDAIKPIKWAFDAVSCIMDKVVTPVINYILEKTGIQDLINKIEDPLKNALNIDSITSAISSGLQISALTSFTAELEGDGAQFILSWNSIYKALSAYSMNADDARRKAVNDLANAISAAPGGTAGPIQPWPDAPSPNIPATPPAPQASVYMSDVVSIQSGLAAMTRLSVAAEQITLLQGAADAPTAPLGPEWAQVSTLQSDIDHVSPKLSAIIPSVVGLTVKVDALPGTTKLPTLLGHQLSDIQIAFKTASDLAALISQLPMMSDPLAPVVAALNDQLQLCVSGSADLTQLNGAVTGVATAVSSASTGLPTNKDISGFQSALSGWSQSAGMLAQSIVEGRSVNSTTKEPLHSQNEAALQSKADQLNARCAELSQLVNTVGQNADAILSQTNTIAQQLGIYASALTPIADHAHVMSAEGQASADQIASLMKTIDSLVDPLSLLLGTLSCTTQTPEKTAANQALQVLVSTARGGVSVTAGKIQSIIDSILERAIPLKQLNQDAGSANQALSPSMQAAFQQSTQALGAALSTLADAMKDDRSYTVQAGTAPPKVISNKFIDTATGVSTIALFRSLSAPVAAIPQEASA